MTGKVIWHMTMSLDGFIAGPDDELDWTSWASDASEMADEVVRTTGAFMAGGRLVPDDYDVEKTKPYGGAWSGPVFLLTHRDPATAPDPSVTYLSGDIRDAVETGLKAANGKNLVVTGGSVPRQCVTAGLVDEIVVHVIPILLGGGVPFFDNPGGPHIKLEVIGAHSGQGIDLRFRVVK